MRTGRPKQALELSAEEAAKLELLARRPKSAQAAALRARIVLGCAQAKSNAEVAATLQISAATVCKWRRRFLEKRIAGLLDERRPGAPRSISDEQIEAVITQTLEAMLGPSTHWSTRRMAEKTGLSQSAIVRIWRAFGLQPHRGEGFKPSKDQPFVETVRDIVGLYMDPPDRALALCLDDAMSQPQAPDCTHPALPPGPGAPERQSQGEERHGAKSLFAALNAVTHDPKGGGRRLGRRQEFLTFLKRIDEAVAADRDVHLLMDNYGTQGVVQVRRWLARRPRYHIHFKPTNGIWLNLIERLLTEVTERCASSDGHTAVKDLEQAMLDFLNRRDKGQKPFVWTADAGLTPVGPRLIARIYNSQQ